MRKIKLLALSILVCTLAHAQTTLHIQNLDSNMLTIVMKEYSITSTIDPKGSSKHELTSLKVNPEYIITSPKGKFGQTISTDELLPKGDYTMVIMWNKKDEAYKVRIKATDN